MTPLLDIPISNQKLPWNRDKSWAGSVAFVGGCMAASAALLARCGLAAAARPAPLAAVAVGCALVESMPAWGDLDNAAVWLCAAAMSAVLL